MPASAAPPARPRRRTAAALRRRPLASATAACWLLALPPAAHGQPSLPTGASIAAGQARIATSGRTMTVTSSANAILDWQSFSIGADHAVRFEQPDAASRVLNRVTGRDPSAILGSLSSNGAVWLLNPNGVLFGAGARVDVGALVASTLRIDDAAWLRGRHGLAAGAADAPSAVVNRGELRSSLGGTIALVGDSVRNEGLIQADGGQVVLAAGRSVELVDSGAPNLGVRITAPAGEALNLGRLLAAGGRIDLHAATVNQQGIVRADGLREGPGGSVSIVAGASATLGGGSATTADGAAGGGSVRVESRQCRTTVQGLASADSRDGAGGAVHLFGAEVGLLDGARVSASGATGGGEVLVGGGARGQDARYPNASAVYVAPRAALAADAGATGDGGRIVLWSDRATRAFGSFSARGGAQGGDGGLVETSGGWIDARPGRLDVSAPHGKPGGWLLDPHDVLVSDDVETQGVDASYKAGSDSSTINAGDLQRALDAGTDVTISTGGTAGTTGSQPGDVGFSFANIRLGGASPGSLTVLADRNVSFESSSYVSANRSSLSIRTGGAGSGAFSMPGSRIDTGGGDFSVGGSVAATDAAGQPFTGARGVAAGSPGISIDGSRIDARGGSITLQGISASGDGLPFDYYRSPIGVTLTNATLRGRSITVLGNADGTAPKGFGIYADFAQFSATHDITLRGSGGGIGAGVYDSGVLLMPGAFDATAKLQMRGAGFGDAPGLQVGVASRPTAAPLVVGNGATVDLAGSNAGGGESAAAVVLSTNSPTAAPFLDASSAGSVTVSVFGSGRQGVSLREVAITGSSAPLGLHAAGGRLDVYDSALSSAGALRLAGRDINLDFSGLDGTAIDVVAERSLRLQSADAGGPTTRTLTLLAGQGGAGGAMRIDSSRLQTSGGSLVLGGGGVGIDADGGSFAGAGGGTVGSGGDDDGVMIASSSLRAGSGELRVQGVGPSGAAGAAGVRVVDSTLTGGVVTLRGAADAGGGVVVEGGSLTAQNNLDLVGFGASPGVRIGDHVVYGDGASSRAGPQLGVSAASDGGTGRQLRINGFGLGGSGVVIATSDGAAPVLQAGPGAAILLQAATGAPKATALVLQGAGARSRAPFAAADGGSVDTLADSTTLDALRLAGTTGPIGLNRLQGASRLALTDTAVESGAGPVRLGARSVTLAGSGSVRSAAGGDAIVVADGASPVTAFGNEVGAAALQAPNGRWIVYAASPTDPGFSPGALPYDFKRYGAAAEGWAADRGNGFAFADTQVANYSGTFATRTYDAGRDARVQSLTVDPGVPGDTARAGSGVSAQLAGRNAGVGVGASLAGTGAVTFADASGKPVYGYAFSGRLTGDVTPAPLAVAGLAAQSKVYDATPLATLAGAPSIAPYAGDAVALSGTASGRFDDKNVGRAKPVAVGGLFLGGADAGNYLLRLPALAADITAAPLAIAGLTAQGKVYDATRAATLAGTPSIAPYAGDTVALAGAASGRFDDPDVGRSKPVRVSGLALTGADAANYVLVPPSPSADILPATLLYVADPALGSVGAPPSGFTGRVAGFVGGEDAARATTGELSFTSDATGASPPGAYALRGGGLTARNYDFSQAPGNATALTLVDMRPQVFPTLGRDIIAALVQPSPPGFPAAGSPAGGFADLTGAVAGGAGDAQAGASAFAPVRLSSLSPVELQSLLDARERYKQAIFSESLSRLSRDPTLADLRACQSVEQVAAGGCLVTEQLKHQLQPGRDTAVDASAAIAADGPTTADAAVPAAPSVVPPPDGGVAPALASLPALTPGGQRRVVQAALPQIVRKVAVVIGVDKYDDPAIPALGNAVRDARSVGRLFESALGYETVVLADANRATVVGVLNRLAIELGPRDSVVVYYAGHGEVVPSTGLGYWQLADSDARKPQTWLSNADIGRLISRIGASQVAVISDSCYSGSLVGEERIRATPGKPDPQTVLQRKSVVVMSSGGNEPVFDEGKQGHSPFAWSLMKVLRQVGSWQPGSQVFERVRFAVARELPQRPQYGASSAAGHQSGGDYLFEQRQLAPDR